MRPFAVAALSLLLAVSAARGAQLAGALSGPVLGFVLDSKAGKVRPVRGIPGSATIGPPVELEFSISQMLALDARRVITSTDSPDLLMLDLGVDPISTRTLAGVPQNPSQAVASLQGTAAAFYYADAQQVVIVSGLPQTPRVSRHDGLSHLSGRLTHMAVNNDGTLLVYSMQDVDGDRVFRWSSSLSTQFLTPAVSVGALAITGSNAAIVADREANELVVYWDAGGAATRQFLAGVGDGVSNPVGVGVSSGNQIYVANAGSASVMAFNSDGRMTSAQVCTCKLSGATLLREGVFRLTDRVDQPLFLLDAGGQGIVFVPPSRD